MKTIQAAIEDLEEKILQNELLDIQKWTQDAIQGKIGNIKARLLKEAQEKLLADPDIESIPATVEGMLELYFSRPYYLNRQQKEQQQQG